MGEKTNGNSFLGMHRQGYSISHTHIYKGNSEITGPFSYIYKYNLIFGGCERLAAHHIDPDWATALTVTPFDIMGGPPPETPLQKIIIVYFIFITIAPSGKKKFTTRQKFTEPKLGTILP